MTESTNPSRDANPPSGSVPPAPPAPSPAPGSHGQTASRRGSKAARRISLQDWLFYRSWRWVVICTLIFLGLINLYPFVWMLGTSVKTTAEAAANRQIPWPLPKVRLASTDERMPYAQMTLADQSILRVLLQRARGLPQPPRIDIAGYALLVEIDEAEARAKISLLIDQNVLRPVDDPDAPDTFELIESQARTFLFLISLYESERNIIENHIIYVPTRTYRDEYMREFGVDADTADAELQRLLEEGWVVQDSLQFENYTIVLRDPNTRFDLRFATSLVMTLAVMIMVLMMTSMFGYALARLSFPGKMLCLTLLLVGSVAPREAVIIPIFRMIQSVGMLENLWGVTLWLTGVGVGNSLLMAGFFMTLPREVEEAARVDGAGPFRTFFDVALPMARPIMITIGLFAFLSAWNDFLIPLIATMSRQDLQPLAVALYDFQKGRPGLWAQFNAAAAIMIIPVIIGFIILQRHIIKGIAIGAVKG